MSTAYDTYLINIGRVRNFIMLYNRATQEQGRGRRDLLETDILRAGVVFLHSSVEEYLRTIILQAKQDMLLTDSDKFKSVLENVSLCGENSGRSAGKKYALTEFWSLKDKTILTVVNESLKDKIGYMTFNSYSQIVSSLKEINVTLTTNHNNDAIIDNYIDRRHKIVHEADKNATHGRGYFQSASISTRMLNAWIIAVDGLIQDIEKRLPN